MLTATPPVFIKQFERMKQGSGYAKSLLSNVGASAAAASHPEQPLKHSCPASASLPRQPPKLLIYTTSLCNFPTCMGRFSTSASARSSTWPPQAAVASTSWQYCSNCMSGSPSLKSCSRNGRYSDLCSLRGQARRCRLGFFAQYSAALWHHTFD